MLGEGGAAERAGEIDFAPLVDALLVKEMSAWCPPHEFPFHAQQAYNAVFLVLGGVLVGGHYILEMTGIILLAGLGLTVLYPRPPHDQQYSEEY